MPYFYTHMYIQYSYLKRITQTINWNEWTTFGSIFIQQPTRNKQVQTLKKSNTGLWVSTFFIRKIFNSSLEAVFTKKLKETAYTIYSIHLMWCTIWILIAKRLIEINPTLYRSFAIIIRHISCDYVTCLCVSCILFTFISHFFHATPFVRHLFLATLLVPFFPFSKIYILFYWIENIWNKWKYNRWLINCFS